MTGMCSVYSDKEGFPCAGATTGTKRRKGFTFTIFASALCKSKSTPRTGRYPNKTVLSIKIFVLLNWKKLPIFLITATIQPPISSSLKSHCASRFLLEIVTKVDQNELEVSLGLNVELFNWPRSLSKNEYYTAK